MKRPLIWITVGYITGIIWGLYLKESIAPIFLLFGGIFILFIKTGIINFNCIKEYKFFIISFIVFSIISNIQINYLQNKYYTLYKSIENEKIQIIGTVISERKETTYKASYTIKVKEINGNAKFKKTNLIIYIPKNTYLEYGEKVRFNGSYEEVKGRTNYKAFDYKEYLKTKNVYGTVNVSSKIEILKELDLNPILIIINQIRTKIKSNLKEILGESSKIAIGILIRGYFRNTRRNCEKF